MLWGIKLTPKDIFLISPFGSKLFWRFSEDLRQIDRVLSGTYTLNSRGKDREMTFCETTPNPDSVCTVLDPLGGSRLQTSASYSPPSGQLPEWSLYNRNLVTSLFTTLYSNLQPPPDPHHTHQAGRIRELMGPDKGDTREWWGLR